MNPTRILSFAAAWIIPLAASAQEASADKLTIRAFLNDPANPVTELFAPDSPDRLIPLVLAPGELPAGQAVAVIDGKLNVYTTAKADPASLLATATVPPDLKRAIAIIQPRGDTKKPPCSIVFVDDSIAAFPPGASRAISFTTLPIALQAGEHKIAITPGKITSVPPVVKVDAYNMAQTNFLYKAGQSWVPFNETKMKYLKEYRQIFICAVRPATKIPTLVTLLDDTPKSTPP